MKIIGMPAFESKKGNPYNWLLYTHMIGVDPGVTIDDFSVKRMLLNKYDIWHMHWPETMFSHRRNLEIFADLYSFSLLSWQQK